MFRQSPQWHELAKAEALPEFMVIRRVFLAAPEFGGTLEIGASLPATFPKARLRPLYEQGRIAVKPNPSTDPKSRKKGREYGSSKV